MSTLKRIKLFDAWAADYDRRIETGTAPVSFEGYEHVLAQAVALAQPEKGMRVLDLGTGTGNLAARFLEMGCEVWGVDFSAQMLAVAQVKMPRLYAVQANLLDGEWPDALNQRYDRIVSSYVLHDLDLAHKMQLLARLAGEHLVAGGCIVIADIAYPDHATRAQARARWGRLCGEDEHYWAADETITACQTVGLDCSYRQVSSCAGVFVMRPCRDEP